MKITLDHNCLIDLENGGTPSDAIRAILANAKHQCFVVNVGASEMQRFGVRPDSYAPFEEFLVRIGVGDLPRLDPLGILDVTFWDRCLFAGENDQALFESIKKALFGDPADTAEQSDAAKSFDERKTLNRLCDALTMWCHISRQNDVFLTTDSNFFKSSKLPQLLALGANRICRPTDL
jgi:hypothetical protein